MSLAKRRDGTPVWVEASRSEPLERIELRSTEGGYDEAWLQRLIHLHPSALPVSQIETGFGRPTAVCRELPLVFGAGRTGALDNVFVTDTGGLILVETKLWRNPEARRTVVAQAMEYAATVFRMTYDDFEDAVLRARRAAHEEALSLYELAGKDGELDEAAFVDSVSRNLARGRAIVAVIGDGIREDIQPLAELLQAHAGSRFTFALVELAVYVAPGASWIVVPSVLAQTLLIERGVVSIRETAGGQHRIEVTPTPTSGPAAGRSARAISVGEDEFYELLDQREPGLAAKLRRFLDKTVGLGIFLDRQSGLNLKHDSIDGPPLNLATIRKDGFVDTGPSTWWGRTDAGMAYNEALARLIDGGVSEMMHGEQSALRTKAGKTPRLSDLLPQHEENWINAMEAYIRRVTMQPSAIDSGTSVE